MAKEIPSEVKTLKYWCKLLGLMDWNIVLETNVSPDEMTVEGADGCVDYVESIKAARIQIVDENQKKKNNENEKLYSLRPFDFEETLVHELLHLKFCLLERGSNWEKKTQLRVLHQIVDDIARALVSAKRYNKESE